jgi:hypothetical protein
MNSPRIDQQSLEQVGTLSYGKGRPSHAAGVLPMRGQPFEVLALVSQSDREVKPRALWRRRRLAETAVAMNWLGQSAGAAGRHSASHGVSHGSDHGRKESTRALPL